MNPNDITYGDGPHPEIWFPWGGTRAINPPDLGEAPVRYMVLRDGEPVYSNETLSKFIPDNGGELYWIGVPAKDIFTTGLMAEKTGLELDMAQVLKMRARATVLRNAETPQPPRPGQEPAPVRFIDEIAAVTPTALLVERAKRDYADREEWLKEMTRTVAGSGGIAFNISIVGLPTEEVYRRAFCEAMVSNAFEGFSVDARAGGDEIAPTLMVEVNW